MFLSGNIFKKLNTSNIVYLIIMCFFAGLWGGMYWLLNHHFVIIEAIYGIIMVVIIRLISCLYYIDKHFSTRRFNNVTKTFILFLILTMLNSCLRKDGQTLLEQILN